MSACPSLRAPSCPVSTPAAAAQHRCGLALLSVLLNLSGVTAGGFAYAPQLAALVELPASENAEKRKPLTRVPSLVARASTRVRLLRQATGRRMRGCQRRVTGGRRDGRLGAAETIDGQRTATQTAQPPLAGGWDGKGAAVNSAVPIEGPGVGSMYSMVTELPSSPTVPPLFLTFRSLMPSMPSVFLVR